MFALFRGGGDLQSGCLLIHNWEIELATNRNLLNYDSM